MSIIFSTSNKKYINNIQLVTLSIVSNFNLVNEIITLYIDSSDNLDKLNNYFFNKNIFFEKLFLYNSIINSVSYNGICYYIKIEDNKNLIEDLSIDFILFDFSTFNSKIEKKIINIKKNYYIYMLRCSDNSIYTGIAIDYNKRFKEHTSQKGAKYTKNRLPQKIERVWKIEGRSSASKIEYFIKSLNKKQKEDLIMNPLSLNFSFPKIILEL